MSDDQTAQVPLVESLRSIPKDWREMREIGYCHHRNVPYGVMLHEAADAIESLRAANRLLEEELEDLAMMCKRLIRIAPKSEVAAHAISLLEKLDLLGSPLRIDHDAARTQNSGKEGKL